MEKKQNYRESIGQRLRKARLDKDISLEEVHRATKIHPNVIEALEEDRLENMLGKTYVKAFLKDYAHYLGLNEREIIQQYSSEPALETGEKPVLEQKLILQKKNRKFSHAIIIVSAFIVWLFILGFATVKFINYYKYVIKNKDKEGIPLEKTELEEPKKTELKEKPTEVKEKFLPEAVDVRKDLIPIPKGRTITLTITADKEVWLKVIQDGELAFHGILSKNSKETWQANNEIRLSEIGKPEALKLNVNGNDIDLSGRRLGKNILITHKGIDLEPR